MLHFLYETVLGRTILRILTLPALSELCGRFLDSSYSRFLIPVFVKMNHLDLSICESDSFSCFNDCFCRKFKEEERKIDMSADAFISPCDGLLTVYPIQRDLVVPVKQSFYRISDLLQDAALAGEYEGGYCFVYRLCVDHYHRYCFVDNGNPGDTRKISGVLHTVQPIALRNVPVFTENSREYLQLKTEHFGNVIQMEVGAMLVGKINNYPVEGSVCKGQEKGHFLYGGSTIIVLTQKNQVELPKVLIRNGQGGIETPVRLGQKIARKKKKMVDKQ